MLERIGARRPGRPQHADRELPRLPHRHHRRRAGRARRRAGQQVRGATCPSPRRSSGLTFDGGYPVLHLEGGETVTAKCLLIATGADYRRLGVEGCERFEGRGVYYAATPNEAQMCRGAEVVVVGGGNSAGQAAVFLSGQVRKVYLLIRGDDLAKDMSELPGPADRADPQRRGPLQHRGPADARRRLSRRGRRGQRQDGRGADAADRRPSSASSARCRGPTGCPRRSSGTARASSGPGRIWPPPPTGDSKRPPFLLETSRPGVFAAGDVRSGSIKRVASAVGEGAMAVQFVHQYMKEH